MFILFPIINNYVIKTAFNAYNAKVSQPDAISVGSVHDVPPRQHALLLH